MAATQFNGCLDQPRGGQLAPWVGRESVAFAAILGHLGGVNATAVATAPQAPARSPLSIERFLTAWVEAVNDYLQRQYQEIIQQEPSPQKLAQYRLECKWLLRSALKLDSLVRDPEYPAPYSGTEIKGKLLQLQESWESFNNPMPDAEADAILQKVFPDAPGAGSAA
jgi:hypothetical protein